ncbi:MAG: ATP-binding cassette domain-containing protein [Paludibacter sp.]|nr:ATP-binding cassette domain-containing protein [Paludibacter sp.]
MNKHLIQLNNISKTFEVGKLALDKVSLSISQGGFITIIGPSGCGKTTLLRIINRMTDFDSGSLNILDKEIELWDGSLLRRNIGYVIQNAGLFPHLTVRENIQFVMSISGMDKKLRETRTFELSEMIEFTKAQLNEYPDNLSGGQQQRVGIARALAMKPQIVLLDEPFGSLDNITRRKLQAELKQIHADTGTTMLMVTHDLKEAFSLGTEMVIMNNGKILQKDKPEIVLKQPVDEWVREFVSDV